MSGPPREPRAPAEAGELSLRVFAERAPDMFFHLRLGAGGGFVYVSPAAAAITGRSPAEHFADPELWSRIVHPSDSMLLQGLLAGDAGPAPLVLRWLREDGGVVWSELRSWVLRDAAGRPRAIAGVARDVTARRRTEEALSQALDAERQARHVAEVLHSAHLALTRSLDAGEVLAALLAHLERLVPYDSACVMLLEGEGRLAVRAVRGYERFIGGGQLAGARPPPQGPHPRPIPP
ncbi:MAG TPA: PAS domain S-box protein, partial [Chloroflexaceae bacterium]|nr:PAS domain S-box protein [Chloroflexaceae bacterium]